MTAKGHVNACALQLRKGTWGVDFGETRVGGLGANFFLAELGFGDCGD